MEIMNTEQNHQQQPILKQAIGVPQLLYVKIKDHINMTPLTNSLVLSRFLTGHEPFRILTVIKIVDAGILQVF